MRVLLTANASYIPPRGGATRSNLIWLEALSARGHTCRVVASALVNDLAGKLEQIEREEIHQVPLPVDSREGIEVAQRGSIVVYSVADPARRTQVLREQIREFDPDWVLVSSEDLGQLLLREALYTAPGKVVYLAHTPQLFPFGPASWNPDPRGADLVRQCAAMVAIGEHMAQYIRQHSGREAAVIHPPIYGSGPFEKLGAFDKGLITMINPCAVKGIAIFLALAERFPEFPFGALPGWGTTAADRRAFQSLPNVTLLAHAKHISTVLENTRLFLMPSLWYEGFGLSVMEAMLHGLPVLASDSGGLLEAKLGTRFILPVRPIERYKPVFDERGLPEPAVPPQDIDVWADALRKILSDRALYEEESEVSRVRALRFVESVRAGQLEEFLLALRAQAEGLCHLSILLAQNSPYYPAHGGGDKSNRLLLEALASRGHACRVVARTEGYGPEAHEKYLRELAVRSVKPAASDSGVVVLNLNAVEVHVVTSNANLRAYFAAQIASFRPDVILSSTDDPAQLLLDVALRAESTRVVYLARATLAVPFGPDCAFPSAEKTQSLRRVDAAVGVSQYVANYIRKWSGIEAVHVPISLMEPGPYACLGRLDNEFVTFVNPCAVKGISIFLALAERMPDVRFAAVPTWGTSAQDRAALEQYSNIHILDPVDDIDRLLVRTRVLLAPSLWAEARSRIVVEAMLRGIPVVASNVGGIPEAKMGVDYLLPVRPIEKYHTRLDEQMVPIAEVPEQDIEPWYQALRALLSDPIHYEWLSRASREAALSYVENLSAGPFENLLEDVIRRPKRAAPEPLKQLSEDKRKLLALRLRQRASAARPNSWFPSIGLRTDAKLRLFCFPYAGGGASAFHGWGDSLSAAVAVCPVRLPGRESRLAEPPLKRMDALVEALAAAIVPYLGTPFAFFGHSMGAAIAFELARALRRRTQPLPVGLLVSGARAPQFRLSHVASPEPTESEFMEELRRLEGIPKVVLENEELLRVVLPALQADTTLYRNYVYVEAPPLDCPIRVYGGLNDPNVSRIHLEAWRNQTTRSFSLQMFEGGHFFINTAKTRFLEELGRDLDLPLKR